MSDISSFPYSLLWEERCVRSVANLTRVDGEAFFRHVTHSEVATSVVCNPLHEASRALNDLRAGGLGGAAVLVPGAADTELAGQA
jgi:propanol-preferring alcohol dehydrogenase